MSRPLRNIKVCVPLFLCRAEVEDIRTDCMIKGGVPQNASFIRDGTIPTTAGVFGPNGTVIVAKTYIHTPEITEAVPAYDISPVIRPTAPDTYPSAASAADPSTKGLSWDLAIPENAWINTLLGTPPVPSDIPDWDEVPDWDETPEW